MSDINQRITEIFKEFKIKLTDITRRKKVILQSYRTALQNARIKEIKDSLFKKQ